MNNLTKKFAVEYTFEFLKNTAYDRVQEVTGTKDPARLNAMKEEVISLMGEKQRMDFFLNKVDSLVINIFPKVQERYRIGK